MMKLKYFFLVGACSLLGACNNPKQQNNLSHLDKTSAREVNLSTVVKGDSIYHITSQTIWANDQVILTKSDTIKTLKEISDWNASTPTSLVNLPIFVTVQ